MKILNNINIIWISLYQEKKTCCNEKTMILTLSDTIVSILRTSQNYKKKMRQNLDFNKKYKNI